MEARRAHNPEVVGSSPASATRKRKPHHSVWFFFLSGLWGKSCIDLRVMRPASVARWVKSPARCLTADAVQAICVQRSVCNAAPPWARRTPGHRKPGCTNSPQIPLVRRKSSPASATIKKPWSLRIPRFLFIPKT